MERDEGEEGGAGNDLPMPLDAPVTTAYASSRGRSGTQADPARQVSCSMQAPPTARDAHRAVCTATGPRGRVSTKDRPR